MIIKNKCVDGTERRYKITMRAAYANIKSRKQLDTLIQTIKEVHPDNYGAALLKYWEDGYRLKVLSTIGIISTSTPVED